MALQGISSHNPVNVIHQAASSSSSHKSTGNSKDTISCVSSFSTCAADLLLAPFKLAAVVFKTIFCCFFSSALTAQDKLDATDFSNVDAKDQLAKFNALKPQVREEIATLALNNAARVRSNTKATDAQKLVAAFETNADNAQQVALFKAIREGKVQEEALDDAVNLLNEARQVWTDKVAAEKASQSSSN